MNRKASNKASIKEINIYPRFIAITVSDLKTAEQFYKGVFDMEIIGRESELEDGLWYTLPFDKGWDEAEAAGVKLGMVGLKKGKFVLVLFRGEASPGQIYAIGLGMTRDEITSVKARLNDSVEVMEEGPDYLAFRDPNQITWQISFPGVEFRTAGDFADRWLQI